MLTQEILQKLEKAYGRVGTVRLVVYGDFSGHTEVRDSASWVTVFPFENLADLEAHLTRRPVRAERFCKMTFEKLAHDHLFNNGMFETDVQKVIEMAKQDQVLKDTMSGRWQDDLEGYPPFMKNVFLVSLNSVATKYIDEHQPKAWYRAIFAGG